MPRYFGKNEEFQVKEGRGRKRQSNEIFNNSNDNDVGIVHYRCSTGLRSPPGYSPKRARRRPKEKITLADGSLFKMSLKFMALNIDLLDSLVGLPDILGEHLFSALIHHNALVFKLDHDGQLTPDDRIKTRVLGLFDEAYHEMVLSRLTLLNIPEKIDIASLMCPFRNIVELDLSGRVLADDILSLLSRFYCLEKLVLQNNQLTDGSVMKLTRPYRVFTDNPQELEVLDVGSNIGITNRSLEPLFSVFNRLKTLNLTGTSVVMHQSTTYELKQFGWRRIHSVPYTPIVTEGWALPIFTNLQNWGISNEPKSCPKAAKFYTSKKKKFEVSDNKKETNLLVLARDAVSHCTSKLRKEALLGVEIKRNHKTPLSCSNFPDEALASFSDNTSRRSSMTKNVGKSRKFRIKPRVDAPSYQDPGSNSFFASENDEENEIFQQYMQCETVVKRKGLLECLDNA